jgi:AAA domain
VKVNATLEHYCFEILAKPDDWPEVAIESLMRTLEIKSRKYLQDAIDEARAKQERTIKGIAANPKRFPDLAYTAKMIGLSYEELERRVGVVTAGPPWREVFHRPIQLRAGKVVMLIERILPEGVSFLGSLPGVGKTLIAMSIALALTTGKALFGVFRVPAIIPVIYLCPEMGEQAIRTRCELLGIPMDDNFHVQTVSDGVCKLDSPALISATKELKPAIMLDSAVRFIEGDDENSATQANKFLAARLIALRNAGARAVLPIHHATKASGKEESMTLENVLRGSGDIAAIADCVWGVAHDKRKASNGIDWDVNYLLESQEMTRLHMKCVKPRDFEPASSFRIQGRPYIDNGKGFVVLDRGGNEEMIIEAIKRDLKVSERELIDRFSVGRERLLKIAWGAGYERRGPIRNKSGFGVGLRRRRSPSRRRCSKRLEISLYLRVPHTSS